MSGTKVDQANLVVEHGGSFAAATTHFQCLYEFALFIDATGNVSVAK